jgi:branched-chain amino acid transport system substrate-binding protein
VADAALAFLGPLGGPFSWVGESLCRSVELSLRHAVEDGLLERAPALRRSDAAGGAEQAAEAARAIAADPEVVAVVGPTFSREAEAAGPILEAAGIPFLLPVATKPELGERGWSCFHRLVAGDAVRAPLTAALMRDELGVERAAVVRDGSDSGRRLAELLAGALAEAGVEVVHRGDLERDDDSYLAAAEAVAASGADGVYFAGEAREAALLRRELAGRGAAAAFVSDDGVLTPAFVELAGAAAEGALVTFPGAEAERALPRLVRDYRAEHGAAPAAFAVEAYEAAALVAGALAAGAGDRAAVCERLRDGPVAFDEHGERVPQRFYAYEVADGAWRLRGPLTAPAPIPGGAPA